MPISVKDSQSKLKPTKLGIGMIILILSWYGMEAVHELGHVVHALASGGIVNSVSIPLWGISCTHINPNPYAAFVVWGGPIWGSLIPITLWLVVKKYFRQPLLMSVAAFFAGFCCIANGAYLGIGWMDRVGDAGDLMREGVSVGWLIGFGMIACVSGLIIWHLWTNELRKKSVGQAVTDKV
ncbi:MAG TPA: hypothetical protein DD473_16735 [Planctomycetaceae bacterium]|nr:hypothetical protein [Planctomycetaceae bacterium]|tara:strand:+ start:645 stop:1187 length:543 start_codon:yes stop_codon:yes gene_type:complete